MAVLIEAISVVTRRAAIDAKYRELGRPSWMSHQIARSVMTPILPASAL